MCKFGDVIVVKDYIGDDGKRIKKTFLCCYR